MTLQDGMGSAFSVITNWPWLGFGLDWKLRPFEADQARLRQAELGLRPTLCTFMLLMSVFTFYVPVSVNLCVAQGCGVCLRNVAHCCLH